MKSLGAHLQVTSRALRDAIALQGLQTYIPQSNRMLDCIVPCAIDVWPTNRQLRTTSTFNKIVLGEIILIAALVRN